MSILPTPSSFPSIVLKSSAKASDLKQKIKASVFIPELFPENSLRWIALSKTKAMRAEKPKPKKPLPKRTAQHLGR
jgi:hypothetical protein